MFQFTSIGGRIDNSINNNVRPYIFRINGQNHHRIGSLLPTIGHKPKFAQLYIYDIDNDISNRMSIFAHQNTSNIIDKFIVEGLIKMFDETNEIVKVLRQARDRCEESDNISIQIKLLETRNNRDKNYATPIGSELARLIVGDVGESDNYRDIIVENKTDGLKRISELHPCFMAMQYLILFPYGEDGYRLDISYFDSPVKKKPKRKHISMREYYAYIIQQRNPSENTLLRGGRLFQQFIVDAFCAVEEMRLQFVRNNQKTLRTEVYQGLRDAVSRGDLEANAVGKRIILPATFTGSAQYLFQNYQDAMAICRHYGCPDLFITFTCNARWSEINEALSIIHGQQV